MTTPIIEPEIKGDKKPDVADDLALIVRNAIAYINRLERQINELKRAAPPQRKPLSETKIEKLLIESAGMTVQFNDVDLHFARAIERAHGIK